MSSPCSSKCSNRKRRDHRLPIASSSSSPAEATLKRDLDHYQLLDVESSATSAHIKSACCLIARKDEGLEDRISRLPDDILINIVSRLTLAEAAATSVLSTRWKYLWTFINVLNFHALALLMNLNKENLKDERAWYVNWVNKVLQLHRGSSIDEFKVDFDLDASHESDITNWIYTAVLKRVQNIELKFIPIVSRFLRQYTFPQELYDRLKTPCFLSCIKSLKSLCLEKVNVTGEILEFFIYNCPYLEELRVVSNDSLLRLKVDGSLLRMKHLHIHSCHNLEELEISCPSLLSFKYSGRIIKYGIKNVPYLVDVSIAGDFQFGVGGVIGPIESYFPQLETLHLEVELNEESNRFLKFQLPVLRQLTLDVFARNNGSNLLDLTCMMEACPLLQKLTLELPFKYSNAVRSRHHYPKRPHQHLKMVELIGFSWDPVELELARYLLENTMMLEELYIEPCADFFEDEDENAEESGELAKQLQEAVPPGIKLVIEGLNL